MSEASRPLTLPDLQAMKHRGEKIAALTAYDASMAAAMEASGIDLLLVGDSLGMVVQGHGTTLPVTLEQMVYHAACVSRNPGRALRAVDLPFMSYATVDLALESAGRLMRDGGVQMVKLEGGKVREETVRALTCEGVPVCAHLGLLPQSVHRLGGYGAQGRGEQAGKRLLEEALGLQEAGASLLVLECIPALLASELTAALSIPTIGIGAGPHCDGQILVTQDMLGITPRCPRFCRDFLGDSGSVRGAFLQYVRSVKSGEFPGSEQSF